MTTRLVVHYGRGPEIQYVGHLDLMRAWERAVRRGGLPIAYSKGFSPHPRLSTAAPLPVGITSQAEVLDIWLEASVQSDEAATRLRPQMPPGLEIISVQSLLPDVSPAASRLRAIEYLAKVIGQDVAQKVYLAMAKASLPWREERGGKSRYVDLRPLIYDIQVELSDGDNATLALRLAAGSGGTARPQAVLSLLDLTLVTIHRMRLIFEE